MCLCVSVSMSVCVCIIALWYKWSWMCIGNLIAILSVSRCLWWIKSDDQGCWTEGPAAQNLHPLYRWNGEVWAVSSFCALVSLQWGGIWFSMRSMFFLNENLTLAREGKCSPISRRVFCLSWSPYIWERQNDIRREHAQHFLYFFLFFWSRLTAYEQHFLSWLWGFRMYIRHWFVS